MEKFIKLEFPLYVSEVVSSFVDTVSELGSTWVSVLIYNEFKSLIGVFLYFYELGIYPI